MWRLENITRGPSLPSAEEIAAQHLYHLTFITGSKAEPGQKSGSQPGNFHAVGVSLSNAVPRAGCGAGCPCSVYNNHLFLFSKDSSRLCPVSVPMVDRSITVRMSCVFTLLVDSRMVLKKKYGFILQHP